MAPGCTTAPVPTFRSCFTSALGGGPTFTSAAAPGVTATPVAVLPAQVTLSGPTTTVDIGLTGSPTEQRLPAAAAWGGYPGGLEVSKGEPLIPRIATKG